MHKIDISKRILQAINSHDIFDQEQFLNILDVNYGMKLTQSALSRKLSKLGIKKIDGKYAQNTSATDAKYNILYVPPNIIIIKTDPGYANAYSVTIDSAIMQKHPLSEGMVATIAGDDTIALFINQDKSLADQIMLNLKKILQFKN